MDRGTGSVRWVRFALGAHHNVATQTDTPIPAATLHKPATSYFNIFDADDIWDAVTHAELIEQRVADFEESCEPPVPISNHSTATPAPLEPTPSLRTPIYFNLFDDDDQLIKQRTADLQKSCEAPVPIKFRPSASPAPTDPSPFHRYNQPTPMQVHQHHLPSTPAPNFAKMCQAPWRAYAFPDAMCVAQCIQADSSAYTFTWHTGEETGHDGTRQRT